MKPNELFNTGTTGTVSFEELENAFRTPTQYQHYYERPEASPEPQYQPSGDFPPSLVNPDGEDLNPVDEPAEAVSPERARRTGERIARLIDTGIDFTLSNFVAHNNETYRADEKDLEDIAQCWGEISQEHGWSIGPEWSLIILYIMVYGPLVKQAITDRRVAELEMRQQQLEARMNAMEQNPPTVQPRPDGTAQPQQPKPSPFTHQPAAE